MKVFGIGLNKTGTKTLGYCLEELGFKHSSFKHVRHSMKLTRQVDQGDLEQIFAFVDRFDSFEDWPWPLIYRELDVRYPGSKFILTTRESSASWIQSLKKHAEKTGPTEYRKLIYGHPMPHGFEEEHKAFYERHNQEVRAYFEGRSQDFLEVCWKKGSDWDEICAFLQKPVPAVPFPHMNKGREEGEGIWNQTKRKVRNLLVRARA